MNQAFSFLASNNGRIARGTAGIVLIALGFWLATGAWQWILVIVGMVPLLAGLFDFCVFAPLFGLPFVGERLRRHLQGS